MDGFNLVRGVYHLSYYYVAGEVTAAVIQDVRMYTNYSNNVTEVQVNLKADVETRNYIWPKITYVDNDSSEAILSLSLYNTTCNFREKGKRKEPKL